MADKCFIAMLEPSFNKTTAQSLKDNLKLSALIEDDCALTLSIYDAAMMVTTAAVMLPTFVRTEG